MVRFRIFIGCLCIAHTLFAQIADQDIRPVARELSAMEAVHPFVSVDLFHEDRSGETPDLSAHVRHAAFLRVHQDAVSGIIQTKPELLKLPLSLPAGDIELSLFRTEITSARYRIRTSDGRTISDGQPMAFYRGTISGDPASLAVVSVFENEVRVIYSNVDGDFRIQKMDADLYVAFRDKDRRDVQSFSCDVTESHVIGKPADQSAQRTTLSGNCVEVYFECDYESYQDNNSSILNTEAWVAALFNEVSALYANEEIPVFISDIFVWTSPDPYISLNSTSAMLNEFIDQIDANGYDGRLAHLLSTRGLGGGIAYIDVLCSNSVPCAVSTSLSTNIIELPNYSWNVECVTHEMGHNFGSRHTHNCVWNGNNTQIDDCGSEYGDEQNCYDENDPILPEDGTIMSYCHLIGGIGINMSLGFGPQPGDLIRAEYENAPCNTGICSPPECTEMLDPAPLETLVDVTRNIFWAEVDGADGYKITAGTSPGSGNIANNVDVGSETTYNPPGNLPFNSSIYVKVTPYNLAGNAVGCISQNFTTEPNIAPECTEITDPENGATEVPVNADLFWEHSVGNQQGYRITIGISPGGAELINAMDVGNVTMYDPGNLPTNTTLYVKITPYWSGGNISGCPEISFTTGGAIYCNSRGENASEEWIGNFTLGSFSNASGSQGYSDYTDMTIHVAAGGSYPLSITPVFDGQHYTEYFRIWIDYNHDGIFSNPEERVFQASSTSTVSGTLNIPLNVLLGTTRIRVAMKYGTYSTPCQVFNYGEVEDYNIRIHCNHVTTTDDTGPGSLPWALGCATAGETITFSAALQGDTILLEDQHASITRSVNISAAPQNNIWVKGTSVARTIEVLPGIHTTISGLNIIAGTATEGSAVRNFGNLTLDDVRLRKHPGLQNAMILKNSGTVHLDGECMIE